jgi:hypothetical protein
VPRLPRSRHIKLAVLTASIALLLPATLSAGTIRRAWFYKPPLDGTAVRTIARSHATIVLTKGDQTYRTRLRRAGYRGKVLQYVNGAKVAGPQGVLRSGSSCNSSYVPLRNQVAWFRGDFCRFFHPHEGWFLHNSRGERLVKGNEYLINPGNAGLRRFFRARVLQALVGDARHRRLGYNGIFLDDVWAWLHRVQWRAANSDGTVREYSSQYRYRRAVRGFLGVVRSAANARGFPVWGNIEGHGAYVGSVNGFMDEGFAATWDGQYEAPAEIRATWTRVGRATARGKKVILVAQGGRWDGGRMRFGLAAYLMVANGRVSFRYSDLNASGGYRELWNYPELSTALGRAVGRRRLVSGTTWRRAFRCAIVVVNLAAHQGEIHKRPC